MRSWTKLLWIGAVLIAIGFALIIAGARTAGLVIVVGGVVFLVGGRSRWQTRNRPR
jgi:membrane-bound ClpP family serine protease